MPNDGEIPFQNFQKQLSYLTNGLFSNQVEVSLLKANLTSCCLNEELIFQHASIR